MRAATSAFPFAFALALALASGPALAGEAMPPWVDETDLPLPGWARSVAPSRPESALYAEPGRNDARRGSAQPGARLPIFATRRAAGCGGRWLAVGPFAWMCSDVGELSAEEPTSPPLGARAWTLAGVDLVRPPRAGARAALPPIAPAAAGDDGLPYRYFFAGPDGAYGFANLATALDDAPDQDLEPGFAVTIVEEQVAHGERWGRTKTGRWVALRELSPARPSLFRGTMLSEDAGELDLAWVVADKANAYASERPSKPTGMRLRFEPLTVFATSPGKDGGMVRVSPEGAPAEWLRARDVARPRRASAPPEVDVAAGERWIDVELASQTLVAYVGARPVFATLVSTGKGAPGTELATNVGTFRIWVKIFTTKMDNLARADRGDEIDRHYAMEDVPWVQFFDKGIALHGAFWHRDFGRVHSHGCVNLTPLDARWLFAFTAPHLPAGWTAVLPTRSEQGTVVRVRP